MKSVFLCLVALIVLTAVLVECRPRGGGGRLRQRGGGRPSSSSSSSEEEAVQSQRQRGGDRGRGNQEQRGSGSRRGQGQRGGSSSSEERGDRDRNKACRMTDLNDVLIGEERSCIDSDEDGVTPLPQCNSESITVLLTATDGTSLVRKFTFCTGFNKTAFLEKAREKSCADNNDCNQRDAESTCSLNVVLDAEPLTFCRNPNQVVELNELRDLKKILGCGGGKKGRRGHGGRRRDSSEEEDAAGSTTAPAIP